MPKCLIQALVSLSSTKLCFKLSVLLSLYILLFAGSPPPLQRGGGWPGNAYFKPSLSHPNPQRRACAHTLRMNHWRAASLLVKKQIFACASMCLNNVLPILKVLFLCSGFNLNADNQWHKHVPLYANRSVKFEEDIVSCSRSDGPEEVLSQVCLL